MKCLLLTILPCLFLSSSLAAAPPAGWAEFRRALLINSSSDKAHARAIKSLEKALQGKGFVVTVLADAPGRGGVAYERWVRSIPAMGVSIIYYLGRLDAVKSQDGKRFCYSMHIGGYKEIPRARDPSLGRSRPKDKPWLSLERLKEKLERNTARQNMVVIDCLGIVDRTGSEKSSGELHGQASGAFRGKQFSSFYPGKGAFHPSLDEPVTGPVLAERLTVALRDGGELPPRVEKLGYTVAPRGGVFELKHAAGEVCSPPDVLREGRFGGDQWVDRNGFCFVWCPAGTYMMGDKAFEDAQPVEVTIRKGYWIGKYETLGNEANLFNAGGQKLGRGKSEFMPPGIGSVDRVVPGMEKWQVYSAGKGLAYKGWTYDYPTEAEWEYAARAGTRAGYPCEIKDLGKYGNFADRNLYNDRDPVHYIYANREADDGYGRSFAPVGQFLPNAWGIHDMLGNLAELCSTYYTEELIGGVDPNVQSLPTTRSSRLRVTRGGAWCSPPQYLHVAYRNAFTGVGTPHVGLRLVLRQGPRVTRTRDEAIAALQARQDAEGKSKPGKKKQ